MCVVIEIGLDMSMYSVQEGMMGEVCVGLVGGLVGANNMLGRETVINISTVDGSAQGKPLQYSPLPLHYRPSSVVCSSSR